MTQVAQDCSGCAVMVESHPLFHAMWMTCGRQQLGRTCAGRLCMWCPVKLHTWVSKSLPKKPGRLPGGLDGVAVALSQEKWLKTKEILQHTLTMIEGAAPIPLKTLESYRGSLVYVQRTYPAITPYLKGFHPTIDSWRPDRDKEGWRLPNSQPRSGPYPTPPSEVCAVPRFRSDVLALLSLFSAEVPPLRFVRSKAIHTAVYGFADASSGGFGSTLGTDDSTSYTHGIWDVDEGGMSSNFRELSNLVVTTLEQEMETGPLASAGGDVREGAYPHGPCPRDTSD